MVRLGGRSRLLPRLFLFCSQIARIAKQFPQLVHRVVTARASDFLPTRNKHKRRGASDTILFGSFTVAANIDHVNAKALTSKLGDRRTITTRPSAVGGGEVEQKPVTGADICRVFIFDCLPANHHPQRQQKT